MPSDMKVLAFAATSPNKHVSSALSMNPPPLSVTMLPPEMLPCVGHALVTTSVASDSKDSELDPKSIPLLLTVTGTLPAMSSRGVTQRTSLSLTYLAGELTSPKWQVRLDENSKLDPVIVTVVPPCAGPCRGERDPIDTSGV